MPSGRRKEISGVDDEHSGLGFERVVFFSDAVFAMYGWRRRLAEGLSPDEARIVNLRSPMITAVFAVSIPAALLGLPVAVGFWLVVLPVARSLVGRLGRSPAEPAAPR